MTDSNNPTNPAHPLKLMQWRRSTGENLINTFYCGHRPVYISHLANELNRLEREKYPARREAASLAEQLREARAAQAYSRPLASSPRDPSDDEVCTLKEAAKSQNQLIQKLQDEIARISNERDESRRNAMSLGEVIANLRIDLLHARKVADTYTKATQ